MPRPAALPPALAALLASVAAQPARWRWQLDDAAAPQPMTPALQQWLRRFDAATMGRWRTPDNAAAPPANARVLRLTREAEAALVLQLGDDGAWFAPAGQAALGAADAAALRRALDDATR
ncbi:MAG TPA: hypothetical protein VNU71_09835 [Burkholderiaceae bacterium]|nr:hypothetical protein [Burkholderiaceae bacterium]